MPEGYEAVDAAFGLRTGGLVHDGGSYTLPVVEFRTGGDYALYPVTTTCDGSFSRGPGTLFARAGTIKDDLGAQAARPLSASPQFSALLERICRDAASSRFVADPFNPRDALVLLFGQMDAKGEAGWMPAAEDGFENGNQRVSLRRSGAFAVGGERWSYILTGSRDPECEARACAGGAIGGALFRFEEGKWVLASHAPAILRAGSYGEAAAGDSIHSLRADVHPPLIRVDSGDCHFGYCGASTSLVAVVGGRLAQVWSGAIAEENLGTTSCDEQRQCTDWEAGIRVLAGGDSNFPDFELARKGQFWEEDRGAHFEIDEAVVYRYDPAGSYHEHSRSGGMVEIPAPPEPEYLPEERLEQGSAKNAVHAVQLADAAAQGPRLPDAEARVDEVSRSMNPPRYPPAALRAGITGRVVLVLDVDAMGAVINVSVEQSSRNRDLDRAAMETARLWRVEAAVEDGRPVASRLRVPVDFEL